MAEPSPAERALLALYQRAERALLVAATGQARSLLNGDAVSEAQRREQAVQTVRAAAAAIARRLDVVTPGLLTDALVDAAQAGEGEAARMLREYTGGNAYNDRGIARGVIDRVAAALLGNTAQAHEAILRTTPDRFRTAIADAIIPSVVGTETVRDAGQRAWQALTDQGIATFPDRAGRQWRLSSYVEMATRTATARARMDAKHDRLAAEGHTLVIVQGGGDRCPRCRPWHGRILSLTGTGARTVQVEHATRDGEYIDVQVAGSILDARAAGWGHPQCRCTTDLYVPGITRIPRREERVDTGDQYAARQRQRAIERGIRRAKERAVGALDEQARRDANRQVKAWQARMREHLDANPDLLRRSHREQLGAGNIPNEARRAELAAEAAAPLPNAPRATPVRRLRDGEVEDRMNAAVERLDDTAMDAYGAELDRRDDEKARRRERDQARRDAVEEQRGARFADLLAQGVDEEDAVADVYGVTVEAQRRQAARARLSADGFHGRSFDEQARAAYRADVVRRFAEAEDATNGYMLTRAAAARGMDPLALFTGPEARVRANASPELLEWFDQHGRPTFDEYKAELLDPAAARRMRDQRGDFYQ